jgi:hypothetical protein
MGSESSDKSLRASYFVFPARYSSADTDVAYPNCRAAMKAASTWAAGTTTLELLAADHAGIVDDDALVTQVAGGAGTGSRSMTA